MEKELFTSNMQEKKDGFGEDSNPILFTDNDSILIGVFDGMGGAGGTECVSDYSHDGTNKTQAYVSSRIIRDAIENAIQDNPRLLLSSQFSKELENIIKSRFKVEKEKYPSNSKGILRSALIKEYPTTLAIICLNHSSEHYLINSFWAGDSRNYIWMNEGLFQISIDDLKGNLDPMENLREDAPMSNCINAGNSFTVHHKHINIDDNVRFVAICATDGCFGYYPSPMDFEKTLFDSLKASNTIQDFKERLTLEISKVTADDFSFAIAPIGFKDFHDLKNYLCTPAKIVKDYFDKRRKFDKDEKKIKKRIEKLNKRLSKHKTCVDEKMMELWAKYKQNYLKYMDSDERR